MQVTAEAAREARRASGTVGGAAAADDADDEDEESSSDYDDDEDLDADDDTDKVCNTAAGPAQHMQTLNSILQAMPSSTAAS